MLQCGMKTILPVSKRGAITLPPSIRRKYGLDGVETPLVIVEERDGELVLCPATAVPIRDIPLDKIKDWIRSDEEEMKAFKQVRR